MGKLFLRIRQANNRAIFGTQKVFIVTAASAIIFIDS
jgi:hypothetical protein